MNLTNFHWLCIHVGLTFMNLAFLLMNGAQYPSLIGVMFGCFGIGFSLATLMEVQR